MGLYVELNVQIDLNWKLLLEDSLSATVRVKLRVYHFNDLNRVLRPVDVAKVSIQNVYRTRFKNYEVMM